MPSWLWDRKETQFFQPQGAFAFQPWPSQPRPLQAWPFQPWHDLPLTNDIIKQVCLPDRGALAGPLDMCNVDVEVVVRRRVVDEHPQVTGGETKPGGDSLSGFRAGRDSEKPRGAEPGSGSDMKLASVDSKFFGLIGRNPFPFRFTDLGRLGSDVEQQRKVL